MFIAHIRAYKSTVMYFGLTNSPRGSVGETLVFRLTAFPTKLALRLVQYPKMACLPSGALPAVVSTN